MKRKALPPELQVWVNARKKHHLSHAHIAMARELGLNPKKFGKIDNHEQEPWKDPLAVFIQRLYQKRFSRVQPDNIKSIEELLQQRQQKKAQKKLLVHLK